MGRLDRWKESRKLPDFLVGEALSAKGDEPVKALRDRRNFQDSEGSPKELSAFTLVVTGPHFVVHLI